MTELQYPIGKYHFATAFDNQTIADKIETIAAFPAAMKALADKASAEQIDTPYRPEGWTVRQVINHCADSHLNAYARFKRVLTEDVPTINPYDQNKWAETDDGKYGDIEVSLSLIEALHNRWARFMRSLDESAFENQYKHPEHPGTPQLIFMLGMYAWHCEHHLAHVKLVVK